jgi:uncharacterized phage protein (TIGR02220 family)
MAGYVKVWTDITEDEKFLSLKLNERGVFLQFLVHAKKGRDDGRIFYRDWTAVGSEMGCDRKTARKVVGKISEISLAVYTESENGLIDIRIPNYIYWQEVDVLGVREKRRKNPAKIPPLKEEKRIEYNNIISDLNEKAKTSYRASSRKTQTLINARLNEGFIVDDFYKVHAIKCEEWLNTDMEKYLRPETLYSNKFEGYLNQRPKEQIQAQEKFSKTATCPECGNVGTEGYGQGTFFLKW